MEDLKPCDVCGKLTAYVGAGHKIRVLCPNCYDKKKKEVNDLKKKEKDYGKFKIK